MVDRMTSLGADTVWPGGEHALAGTAAGDRVCADGAAAAQPAALPCATGLRWRRAVHLACVTVARCTIAVDTGRQADYNRGARVMRMPLIIGSLAVKVALSCLRRHFRSSRSASTSWP